jgi:hypothetical protein
LLLDVKVVCHFLPLLTFQESAPGFNPTEKRPSVVCCEQRLLRCLQGQGQGSLTKREPHFLNREEELDIPANVYRKCSLYAETGKCPKNPGQYPAWGWGRGWLGVPGMP